MSAVQQKVSALLLTASTLVQKGWSQRSSARDKDGLIVPVESPHAVAFCARGAIWRALDEVEAFCGEVSLTAVDYVERSIPKANYGVRISLCDYNDASGRTREEVVALLAAAAALARAEETARE